MRVCVRVRDEFKMCQQVKQHRNHPPSGFGFLTPSGIELRYKVSDCFI